MLSPRASSAAGGLAGVAADLDALAADARRSDGIAGGLLTGWLPVSAADVAARDGAARTAALLRGLPPEGDPGRDAAEAEAVQVRECRAVEGVRARVDCIRFFHRPPSLNPTQAALDTLTAAAAGPAKLAGHGLAGLAHLAPVVPLSAAQTCALTGAVGAAADAADDGTRLRALQAAALLAQATPVLHTPGAVADLLGAAGRVLVRAGGGAPRPGAPPPPPLASTAAATARQIVAVAFEAAAHAPATSRARDSALALLYDLCGVASASGAPPPWAAGGAPSGRAHALALLDVALAAGGAPLFAGDPAFADALRTGVRLALLTALQASLSDATPQRAPPPAAGRADRAAAAAAAATAASDAAAALRAARTALGAHHGALGGRAAPLVGVLVAGAARACPPHQRAAVMRVLRDVCGDADLLLFLHSEFDAKVAPPSAATAAAARAGTGGAPTPSAPRAALAVLTAASDDALAALSGGGCGVGGPRSLGGAGRETVDWPPPDGGDSRAERAAAAAAAPDAARKAAALAVDGLLQFAAAAARLADEGGGGAAASARRAAAAALVSDAWRPVADGLVALASSPSSDDDAVARGLKGVLALARAAAGLGLPSPRDALLARLAALALPLDAVGGGGGEATVSSRPPSAPLERARSGGLSLDAAPSTTTAALALAPPHVHALRALFNAAATLGPGLDAGGWAPLLRVVARLDAALADPATIVLEPGGNPASTDSGARDLDVLRGAADALFAGSGAAGDAGVAALATALADVAADEAAAAAAAPAAPPPRALARVADVVLANPGRLAALWPRLEAGVASALASPAPSARAAGVDALRRGVDGVLARARASADSGDTDVAAQADAAALGGVSRAAHAAAAASDGDEAAVLSVLEAALARHGDRLTTAGWAPALALLARVPSDRGVGPAAVRAGWAAVQAAADAFPSLPTSLLPSALDAVAAYIRQGADVNVALSAVGGAVVSSRRGAPGRSHPLPRRRRPRPAPRARLPGRRRRRRPGRGAGRSRAHPGQRAGWGGPHALSRRLGRRAGHRPPPRRPRRRRARGGLHESRHSAASCRGRRGGQPSPRPAPLARHRAQAMG